MAEQCDAVVIVGSDYTDVASPSELSFNARIAANLEAPVLLRAQGLRPHARTRLRTWPNVCPAELTTHHAHLVAIIANRCDPDRLDE